jgi:hypothetical protein
MEDAAVVRALAFEDAARIMEPMIEQMELGVAPRDETTIGPDKSVTIVKRDHGHWVFLTPSMVRPERQ